MESSSPQPQDTGAVQLTHLRFRLKSVGIMFANVGILLVQLLRYTVYYNPRLGFQILGNGLVSRGKRRSLAVTLVHIRIIPDLRYRLVNTNNEEAKARSSHSAMVFTTPPPQAWMSR